MVIHVLSCYIDESGDEQPLRTTEDPPVLVLAGIVLDVEQSKRLFWDFVELKKQFRPRQCEDAQLSDVIKLEVKGSNLRNSIRRSSRRERRAAIGFLDKVLGILERRNATILGEVHVKPDSTGLSRYVYAETVARLAQQFEAQLRAAETQGLMILDARTKAKNTPSVHGITTRRFKAGGDPYPHFADSPVFGHSDAHMALQVADIVASALLFPMACAAYCGDLGLNTHVHDNYAEVGERFGARLRNLEHRYVDSAGRRTGGVRVWDHRYQRPSLDLYNGQRSPERRTADPVPALAYHLAGPATDSVPAARI